MDRTPGYGIDATVGLYVGSKEPISLSLNKEGGVYLVIGENIEVMLQQAHVVSLHEQSTAVLADIHMLGEAEKQANKAESTGRKTSETAEYAREQADKALAAGAWQQGRQAQQAADKAAHAAALVQMSVQATLSAIETAEEATEEAGEAAAAVARAIATRTQQA